MSGIDWDAFDADARRAAAMTEEDIATQPAEGEASPRIMANHEALRRARAEIEQLQAALADTFDALNSQQWSRAAAIIRRAMEPKP